MEKEDLKLDKEKVGEVKADLNDTLSELPSPWTISVAWREGGSKLWRLNEIAPKIFYFLLEGHKKLSKTDKAIKQAGGTSINRSVRRLTSW